MARGKFITDFERDVIRIGKAHNVQNATIARALRRTPAAIGQQIDRMEQDGTIANLPMIFMQEDIADMLIRAGGKK